MNRVVAALSALVVWIMTAVEFVVHPIEKKLGLKGMPWFFLAPNLLLFSVFTFVPIALLISYAFTGGTNILPFDRPFVGLENFTDLLTCENYWRPGTCNQSLFWTGLFNIIWFAVFNVCGTLLVALITALILNKSIPGRGMFRAIFFYPVLLSPVVIGLVWKWFLSTHGILNAVLDSFGIEPIIFMLDVQWSRFWVVFVSVWMQMGFFTLILLAGLQAIPQDIYEAAAIDKTPRWRVLSRITLPMLGPNLVVVLVLLMIRSVQVFDEPWVLTNGGGPGTANSFLVQFIYETAFSSDIKLYGLASAASVMMGITLFALTLFQLFLSRGKEA